MANIKKIAAYVLTGMVIILTILALLGIWEVISFEDVIKKILTSLFVIFISSVILLFIFGVVIRDNDK